MTEKEKSHAGMLYQPGDPELSADRDVTVKKLYDYNNLHPLERDTRRNAIRELLGKTGDNCVVEQPFFCTYGYNTTVGDNFFLNVNGKLMDSGKITIGNNVFIAPMSASLRKNTRWMWSSGRQDWNTHILSQSATMSGFVPAPSYCRV